MESRVPFTGPGRFAGVLFDKDGTLIDFDRTWGPAVYAMIEALAAGDPALMQAQAEALHFSIETRRFLASSPLVAGSTADYGLQLGKGPGTHGPRGSEGGDRRPVGGRIAARADADRRERRRSFRRFARWACASGSRPTIPRRARAARFEALGVEAFVEFVAGYDFGPRAQAGTRAWCSHSPSASGRRPRRIVGGGRLAARSDGCEGGRRGRRSRSCRDPPERPALEPHADHVIAHIGDLPALLAELEPGPRGSDQPPNAPNRAARRIASRDRLRVGEPHRWPAPEVSAS